MKKDIAIEVKGLSKSFRLPIEKSSSIKQAFINWTKGVKGYKEQKVLRDISFNVEKGDFFGVVGRNGSGKSTLLKLISGIYEADNGVINVDGSLVSFIELGVGFNPELTGHDNIYLNGALMGFDIKEIDAMYDEIVEFAELGEFMDQKLKNYSSGMQVRLAFSCAIRAKSDILVLDEILAVGDEAFQRKCNNYFATLKREKKTVILVTHAMDSVQQFCNKAILIQDGKITHSGNTSKVAQAYRELNNQSVEHPKEQSSASNKRVLASSKTKVSGDKVCIDINVLPKEDLDDCIVSVFLDRDTGEQVYRFSSDEKTGKVWKPRKGKTMNLNLDLQNIFPVGVFSIRLSIKTPDRTVEYFSKIVGSFEIINLKSSKWDIHWKPHEKFSITEGK